MIRRPPRSTLDRSSAASDVYKRQAEKFATSCPIARDPRSGDGKMRAFHRNVLKFAFVLMIVAQCAWAADPYPVMFQQGIEAKMRDGTILRADVYRPKAEGTFPVLLQRTPYNKDGSAGFGLKAAERGFVV